MGNADVGVSGMLKGSGPMFFLRLGWASGGFKTVVSLCMTYSLKEECMYVLYKVDLLSQMWFAVDVVRDATRLDAVREQGEWREGEKEEGMAMGIVRC